VGDAGCSWERWARALLSSSGELTRWLVVRGLCWSGRAGGLFDFEVGGWAGLGFQVLSNRDCVLIGWGGGTVERAVASAGSCWPARAGHQLRRMVVERHAVSWSAKVVCCRVRMTNGAELWE